MDRGALHSADKLAYDSHTDSGFLSGSNLMSSNSLDEYSATSGTGSHLLTQQNHPQDFTGPSFTTLSPSSHCPQSISQPQEYANPVSPYPNSPLTHPNTPLTHSNTPLTHSNTPLSPSNTSGCLDSGIDISEQMGSLQIDRTAEDTCPAQPQNMSSSHVSLLRRIFSPDNDGDTHLHIAVVRGWVEQVQRVTSLLPHQAFLDLANNQGKTALHLAVSTGAPSLVRLLVVCGGSPVARDLAGNTPLHLACRARDSEVVSELTRPVTVAEVADAKLCYRPSHTAGLLAADRVNYRGETCIHVATAAGDKAILTHLTHYGADINARERLGGRTALHMAVEAGEPSLVSHLVSQCRASLHVETYSRLTPYQLALANGCPGMATHLLHLGAPALLLPPHCLEDSDSDSDADSQMDGSSSPMIGWSEVDDVRLAGVPVTSSLTAASAPISAAGNPGVKSDLYY